MLTDNQMIHHAEQMDALRRDFDVFWKPQEAELQRIGIGTEEIVEKEIVAWQEYSAEWRDYIWMHCRL
jgi:hypothetical protein